MKSTMCFATCRVLQGGMSPNFSSPGKLSSTLIHTWHVPNAETQAGDQTLGVKN